MTTRTSSVFWKEFFIVNYIVRNNVFITRIKSHFRDAYWRRKTFIFMQLYITLDIFIFSFCVYRLLIIFRVYDRFEKGTKNNKHRCGIVNTHEANDCARSH